MKESELTTMLKETEVNYNTINQNLVVKIEEDLKKSKQFEEEKFVEQKKEADDKIINLTKELAETKNDLEIFKNNESYHIKQIETLKKQIEEMDSQLRSFKTSEIGLISERQIMVEPQALEISMNDIDMSRNNNSYLSVMKSRRESTVIKRKYEIRNNTIQNQSLFNYVPKIDKTMMKYDEMKSIMVNKKESSFLEEEHEMLRSNFQDYFYLCHQDHKILKVIVYKNNVIYILNQNSRNKPLFEIPILNIKQIIKSTGNPFLCQISFLDKLSEEKKDIVMEIPNAAEFFKVISNSFYFDKEILRKRPLNMESNTIFKNASLNLFPGCKKAMFLETWVNSMMYDWKVSFFIYVDDILLKFKTPSVFYYSDYNKIRHTISIYLLDSYNVIKDEQKIGLKRTNTFALKIKNENKDIIFSAMQAEEKNSWIQVLN